MSLTGASHTTVSAHLAGLRHWHIAKGQPWHGRTERIRLALRAVAKSPRPPRPSRLPITVPLLLRLRRRLRREPLPATDRRAAWAAVTLGFFGALRGSEYLAPGTARYSRRRTCLRKHVTLKTDSLTLHLPASKTDQTGRGADITLPRLEGPACPLRAMRAYLASTSHLPGHVPLFVLESGSYATIPWLNGVFRRYLPSPAGRFSTHSLRIGFATAAAAAGATDNTIRASGRWQGSSHVRYIQGPRRDVWHACLAVNATSGR
ncbi:hypothetical protein FJT64_018366 [Amphibalanus amphitrite]|uniref:Tyr recombinase domain-containing protein n=1 Tax=Amphibalanus amphitrite TaxID=1232801 RepID=A0A6A4X8D1_AMPAM|nr:hypothetical protein FJT64_018366 [Amphibalanus amphitrite]